MPGRRSPSTSRTPGGISDRFGFINFGLSLWNGKDPVLKERLFGLTNGEGNHGEDAKEYWCSGRCRCTHLQRVLRGNTGEGLGATHQTGWTALVAHLLNRRLPADPRRLS